MTKILSGLMIWLAVNQVALLIYSWLRMRARDKEMTRLLAECRAHLDYCAARRKELDKYYATMLAVQFGRWQDQHPIH